MKRRCILLFVLLSIQLYGCSARASETDEMDPPASESSLPKPEATVEEDNDTEEPEIPAEEFHDGNSGISAEPEEDPVSIPDTENTDIPVQDMELQPEEAAAVNDSYYRAATDIPRADVESYAAQIRQYFLNHDWQAISSEISYPITISDVTYSNSAEFLDASGEFDGILDEAFFSALEEEDCVEMLCNWEGIMLGESGQIWISEVLDGELHSQGLKIIAVNGMLRK